MILLTQSCLLLLLNVQVITGDCGAPLGDYGLWNPWESCDASCGGGIQRRWRSLCCPTINGAWSDCRAQYNRTEEYMFDFRNCSGICFNGGTYIIGSGCACARGYDGICCSTSIDECAGHPCENGGFCVNHINGYTCTCPAGFAGHNCTIAIDECAGHPCENGGFCVNHINGYTCTCPAGFAGHNCTIAIDECAGHPCENGGFCVNHINGYTCTCPAGFAGHNCTIEIDECASSPCKNGGSCKDLVNGYICTCPSGSSSHDCSTVISTPSADLHDCFFKSSLYVGHVSQTIDNVTCDRWDVHLLPSNLLASKLPDPKVSDAANFCRDPDGKGHPWCYISGNPLKAWEFCDVLFCEECYYANHSQVYNGYVKSTPHGECLNWTGASFIEGYFPDGSVTRAENYCRDPDGIGHPYCLTSRGFTSCSISQCKTAVCADDPRTLCFHLKSVICGISHIAQQRCPKTCAMCGFGLLPPVHVQPPVHRAPCQDDPMARCDVLSEFICADPKTAVYCPKSCNLCSDAVKGEIIGK